MHHLPAGPPLRARLSASLRYLLDRLLLLLPPRPRLRLSARRLAFGLGFTVVLIGLMVAVPVSGAGDDGETPWALDSSSTTAAEHGSDEPVVEMGIDGRDGSSSASRAERGSSAGRQTSAATSDQPAPQGSSEAPAGTEPAPGSTTPDTQTDTTTSAPDSTTADPGTTAATPDTAASAPAATGRTSRQAPSGTPTVTHPPAGGTQPAGDAAGQVVALVNAERAQAGCGSVTADSALAAVARAHSADMRDRGFFDHVNPDGLDPFARAAAAGLSARAENIARGQQDAAAVMAAWMNSSGHRANILDCDLTRLGVGVATGGNGPYWTQLFA